MMLSYVLNVIYNVLLIYGYILSINIILSWIPNADNFKIVRSFRNIGEWYLAPFHDKIVFGVIDFTPMVGIFIYYIIVDLLVLI